MKTWEKSVLGGGTNLWKSPEAEMSLVFSKTGKEASVPRGQWDMVAHGTLVGRE